MTQIPLEGYDGVGNRNEEFNLQDYEFSVQIDGHGGDDFIQGGARIDLLAGGLGKDAVLGGAGSDTIWGDQNVSGALIGAADFLSGGDGGDTVFGGVGNDFITGGAGDDSLVGETGSDVIYGGFGFDAILGAAGNDILWGGGDPTDDGLRQSASTNWDGLTDDAVAPGPWTLAYDVAATDAGGDYLDGGVGADTLYGQRGDDFLFGGPAADKLNGGMGRDELEGGSGKDVFLFTAINESVVRSNRDVIQDFSHGQKDKISLSDIDADQRGAAPGNQAFQFIGSETFADYHSENPTVFGMVRFANGIVQGNVNSRLIADFEIALTDVTSLVGTDFLL